MGLLLTVAVALVAGAVVFGVAVLITGSDPGLEPAEPDGAAVPLPTHRPLTEPDLARVRFDRALRGYRMAQVDQALRRTAYDIGYKDELINVLESEIEALRSGRTEDAEVLRRAREAAVASGGPVAAPEPAEPDSDEVVVELGSMTPAGVPVVEPDARESTVEPATLEPATLEPAAVEPAAVEPADGATGPRGVSTGPQGGSTGPQGDSTEPEGGSAEPPGTSAEPGSDPVAEDGTTPDEAADDDAYSGRR
jgi:DivIVA domain-containing protein